MIFLTGTRSQKEEVEKLNRLIEYSILQQLIYRESMRTYQIPDSEEFFTLKREVMQMDFGHCQFFIAYLIAFEPMWLRVDAMYKVLIGV